MVLIINLIQYKISVFFLREPIKGIEHFILVVISKDTYSLPVHFGRFDTEKKCHDYLMQVRWSGKPTCSKCGNNHLNYYITSRNIYKCSRCKTQFSITQGTIFHRSKIPLTKWFLAIYIFTTKKRGVSSIQMGKWLGVRQRTAWFMLQRLREAMKEENNIILGGIVEADETFVSPRIGRDLRLQVAKRMHEKEQERIHGISRKRKYRMGEKKKRGRKKGSTKEVLQQKRIERGGKAYDSHELERTRMQYEKGTVILGMLERGGKIVMKKLGINTKSITRKNVYPLLRKHISSDSIFITDCFNVYKTAHELFAQHLTVNHDIGYVIDEIHVNNIENAWKHLKKMIDGTYFHISHHHFDGYLNENTYRWNRRDESEKILFENFIPMISGKRITYNELKKRKEITIAA